MKNGFRVQSKKKFRVKEVPEGSCLVKMGILQDDKYLQHSCLWLYPNQSIFRYHMVRKEIVKIDLCNIELLTDEAKTYRLITERGYLYVPAINKKIALRKFRLLVNKLINRNIKLN